MTPKEFFEELNKHQVIAWDFDGTLYPDYGKPYDQNHCHILTKWILSNLEKEHHIITFRNGDLWQEFLPDINSWSKELLLSFKTINPLPGDVIWDKESDYVKQFKAKKAVEIGATILIDDLGWVGNHCRELGISFLNSQDSYKKPKYA